MRLPYAHFYASALPESLVYISISVSIFNSPLEEIRDPQFPSVNSI